MKIKRGEIYKILFDNTKGSEQSEWRYALVLQNDCGNDHSPTSIVCALTSQKLESKLPVHVVLVPTKENGLNKETVALLEQIRTFDVNERFKEKVGQLNIDEMKKINKALKISLNL